MNRVLTSAHLIADAYAEILPDREAFLEAAGRPLPITAWTNTLRLSPARLRALCADEGVNLEPLPWLETAFRLTGNIALGRRWEYLTGLMQIQEEVSMLPGVLLGARPGERVLDLCAAPGNKTAQLAVAMGNRGTLIANDRDPKRLRALGQISKRLGLWNISTTVYDGVSFPAPAGSFDRVVVDAPCTCEGTFRKEPRQVKQPSPESSRAMAQVQRRLLLRALELCRPGGRVLYSTCTFSPLENEAVVSDVLDRLEGAWRVVPVHLPGLACSPGVPGWGDRSFHPEVRHALRIWPHQNDSGGFFVAVLEPADEAPGFNVPANNVNADLAPAGAAIANAATADEGTEAHLQEQCLRFGISRDALDLDFRNVSRQGISCVTRDHRPPGGLELETTGLFCIKTRHRYPKLSTAAAMAFGPLATRNAIALTAAQRDSLLRQENVVVTPEQTRECADLGYVLLRFQELSLGVGLYFPGPGVVRSLFPRYFQGPTPAPGDG